MWKRSSDFGPADFYQEYEMNELFDEIFIQNRSIGTGFGSKKYHVQLNIAFNSSNILKYPLTVTNKIINNAECILIFLWHQ